MKLDAKALDARLFSQAQCDALFAAVLVDDAVDAETPLPENVTLHYSQAQLIDGFCLCRQLWKTGVDREELIALTAKLARDRDLTPEDRLAFKYARAKFKHLRFAFALYGESHKYPTVLDWMTTALGHLQDAFKTGRPGAVRREAALGRLFLARGPQRLLLREIDRLTPTTSAGFRTYVERQIETLRGVLARDTVTGAQFHATRKIVSRQVSFYDNLRTLEPTREAYRMSRALAAINGLMGAMHDELVERRVAGTQDYHRERFVLPEEIQSRLSALVDLYPASAQQG